MIRKADTNLTHSFTSSSTRPSNLTSELDSSAQNITQDSHQKKQKMSNESTSTPQSQSQNEILTLIIHQLSSFGLSSTVNQLEQESGIQIETKQSSIFKQLVLNGDWSLVQDQLLKMNTKKKEECIQMIKTQAYLEYLNDKRSIDAIKMLRSMNTHDDSLRSELSL